MAGDGRAPGGEVAAMASSPEEIKRAAEVDRLISRANVHRMRAEYIEAEDVCREALALDETRADVREFLADMLYARGQLDAAVEEYKRAIELDAGRVSAETKYAKVVIEIGEREHDKQIAQEMIENPEKFKTREKHPLWALVLSVLVPGAGQAYNGEVAKGGIILGVFVLLLTAIAMSHTEVKNLFDNFKAMLVPTENLPPPVGIFAALIVGLLVCLYIYAVIDAPISAGKSSQLEKKLGGDSKPKADEEEERFRKFLTPENPKPKPKESEPPETAE